MSVQQIAKSLLLTEISLVNEETRIKGKKMNDFHYGEVSVQHQTSLNKRARNGVGE